jgi:regulation of enolase protein 1 (concanavalin A-like superfamily)
MVPVGSSFGTLNSPQTVSLPQDMDYFTLTARPTTKIWREPGLPDTITAPIIYTALREPLIVAEVTVTADVEMEWDQAGLVIFAGSSPCMEDHYPLRQTSCRRWAKAGLQFSSSIAHISSAVALSPAGADVALTPLANLTSCAAPYVTSRPSVRIKFERLGDALWMWYKNPRASHYTTFQSPADVSAEWQKVREVAGFFWGVESKNAVWVGCYASRPMQWNSSTTVQGRADDGGNDLWVEFEDLEII